MSQPTVRFRVDFGLGEAVGPGKIALLEHIRESGSLSQAARDLDMSYRRAWLLLESLNVSFHERVAISSKGGRGGGGAALTPFGDELIRCYRAFEGEVQSRAERHFRPIAREARKAPLKSVPAPVVRLSER